MAIEVGLILTPKCGFTDIVSSTLQIFGKFTTMSTTGDHSCTDLFHITRSACGDDVTPRSSPHAV